MVEATPRFGLGTFEPGESWDHTDVVQLVDQLAVERGSFADRPDAGDYDGETYLAEDRATLYQWDDDAGTWNAVAGLGAIDGSSIAPSDVTTDSLTSDEIVIESLRKSADYVIDTVDGEARATNHQGDVAYTDANGDVFALINAINNDLGDTSQNSYKRRFHVVSGNHKYSTTLTGYGGVVLSGEGTEATVLEQSPGANLQYAIKTPPQAGGFLQFRYFKLAGYKTENTDTVGFYVDISEGADLVQDIHWDHVFIDSMPSHGMHLKHTWGHRFDNSLIEHCAGDGILFDGDGQTMSQMHIDNGYIARNDGWGVRVTRTSSGGISSHQWDLQVGNNGRGGAGGGAQLKNITNSEIDIIARGNQNNDGIQMGAVDHSEVEIIASGNGGYGLNVTSSCTGTEVDITGDGNSNGLYNGVSGAMLINGWGQTFGKPGDTSPWNSESALAGDLHAKVVDNGAAPPKPIWENVDNNWVPLRPVTGSYTGAGNTGRAIDLGFNPSWVTIQGSDGTTYDVMQGMGSGVLANDPAGTLSTNTNGFVVGDNGADADPNTDGETYTYRATP